LSSFNLFKITLSLKKKHKKRIEAINQNQEKTKKKL